MKYIENGGGKPFLRGPKHEGREGRGIFREAYKMDKQNKKKVIWAPTMCLWPEHIVFYCIFSVSIY